jgi:5,10-methylenetetrahydrofolate reductase
MDQTLFDGAIATLTAELDAATDERMKERLRDAIANLKDQFPEFVAVAE